MLVKDLIKQLEQFNPDSETVFLCSTESGRSTSICTEGTLDLFPYHGKVVLHIDGEETDYQ